MVSFNDFELYIFVKGLSRSKKNSTVPYALCSHKRSKLPYMVLLCTNVLLSYSSESSVALLGYLSPLYRYNNTGFASYCTVHVYKIM
jgi:hypothetical protein